MAGSLTYEPDWMLRAACRGHGDEFFPTSAGCKGGRKNAVRRALALCRNECPVIVQCARVAVATGTTHGVVAGVDLGDGAKVSAAKRDILAAIANRKPGTL